MSTCRFILTRILSDRKLDNLQVFSKSAERSPEYSSLMRNPVTYGTIRAKLRGSSTSKYNQVETMLADIITFLNNIKKYSAEAQILDAAEFAKHQISNLIRETRPTALHYWMSLTMRPVSPLRNFVKRINRPKSAESDSEDEPGVKRVKIEK